MAKTSNVTSVKTPGEVAAPADQAVDEAAALEAQIQDTSGVALPVAEVPAVDLTDPKQLQAYIQAQISEGISAGLREQRRKELAASGKTPAAELPDQSEVNPKTITKEVLTKQGYVVPDGLGAPPAHLKNLGT